MHPVPYLVALEDAMREPFWPCPFAPDPGHYATSGFRGYHIHTAHYGMQRQSRKQENPSFFHHS